MRGVARVTRRGAARWARGHPWIYRSDVIEPPSDGPGVVRVVDETGAFTGMALWSPASTISLRMLTHEERTIDASFWAERIDRAARYRESLQIDASACRLIHAEADGIPSLVVDRFGDVLVAQLLSAGLEAHRDEIVEVLRERFRPTGILARNDVPVRDYENLPRSIELLWGTVPEELEVREGQIRYLVAPWTGQKTGAFLDQRENRVRAGALSSGRALDCFAYQGGFALHLAAHADTVIAVDSSADALARAEANARLNGFQHVQFVEANVFDFLRSEEEAGTQYDIIVLDPPAFAKRRENVAHALRGYKEINLRAMRLLAPGGYLCTFSCSYHIDRNLFREMIESAAADVGRPFRWIESRGQALDHPEIVQIPETAYLKGAVLQAL
jgi:23S rRNA (cytosine1962-C5)-methyltransferase